MSRSRRKNPILPVTSCRSERRDKQCWHRAWRRWERRALKAPTVHGFDSQLARARNEVCDVWNMSKDGRVYWPLEERIEIAETHAAHRTHTPQERASLKQRILHRWIAK